MASNGDKLATQKGLASAFSAHDLDKILGYFAEDCWLQMPRGPSEVGALRQCGTSRWLLTGTRPNGENVRVCGCDFYHFRNDGKVVGKDSYSKIVD